MAANLRDRLIALIEPLSARLGYELVELEYAAGRSHSVVRLFIDRAPGTAAAAQPQAAPGGEPVERVGLSDCERMSREVSALLDVEDPIPGAYTLEVSSPGFDRVLRTPEHFGRFLNHRVHVELKEPRAGRRRYTGQLLAADQAGIVLEVDQEPVRVSLEEIGKARLAP